MLIEKLITFDELDSTNKYMKQNLEKLDSGTVIIAKNQTNGYGRKDRFWFTDKENSLTFSLLVKQGFTENIGLITQLVAVSVLKTLEKFSTDLSIKWPNDILIKNKKVCGILVENVICNNSASIVIGIGININNKEFDTSITSKATSLYIETKQKNDVQDILNTLLGKLEYYYNQYLNNNIEFLEVSRTKSCLIGKEIFLENQHDKAFVKGIDNLGRLIVEINGLEKAYSGSEVSLSNNYRSI